MSSSKELKEDGEPIDDEKALEGLTKVPVESWKYKDGVEDGGRHVGPYAEDMQAQFGDSVAPGGIGLDMVSVTGQHHAAIRALAKKVDRLERRRAAPGLANVAGLAPVAVSEQEGGGALPPALSGDLSAGLIGLERI